GAARQAGGSAPLHPPPTFSGRAPAAPAGALCAPSSPSLSLTDTKGEGPGGGIIPTSRPASAITAVRPPPGGSWQPNPAKRCGSATSPLPCWYTLSSKRVLYLAMPH